MLTKEQKSLAWYYALPEVEKSYVKWIKDQI
jgi:hypothetical protein